MTDDLHDDVQDEHPTDERLRALAEGYHRPPATPRDAMWAQIQARIAEERSVVPARDAHGADVIPIEAARPPRPWSPPWIGVAAAAALVALGFGLGRFTGPRFGTGDVPTPVAAAPADAGSQPFRMAAAEHLSQSEMLLTLVRTDARDGRVDPTVGEWGRGLLMETRLLLDSPAGEDPELRPVLEDLELLLAQVAQLGEAGVEGREEEELEIIAEGMDAQDMLPRIQAVLPARIGS